MDVLGKRAMNRVIEARGQERLREDQLEMPSLVLDLVANGFYYSLACVGGRGRAPTVGTVLGLCAGLGALVLPKRIGLGDPPHADDITNQMMTVAWYTSAGLLAGATAHALMSREGGRRETRGRDLSGVVKESSGEADGPLTLAQIP
jgi:hypothetical protein